MRTHVQNAVYAIARLSGRPSHADSIETEQIELVLPDNLLGTAVPVEESLDPA